MRPQIVCSFSHLLLQPLVSGEWAGVGTASRSIGRLGSGSLSGTGQRFWYPPRFVPLGRWSILTCVVGIQKNYFLNFEEVVCQNSLRIGCATDFRLFYGNTASGFNERGQGVWSPCFVKHFTKVLGRWTLPGSQFLQIGGTALRPGWCATSELLWSLDLCLLCVPQGKWVSWARTGERSGASESFLGFSPLILPHNCIVPYHHLYSDWSSKCENLTFFKTTFVLWKLT